MFSQIEAPDVHELTDTPSYLGIWFNFRLLLIRLYLVSRIFSQLWSKLIKPLNLIVLKPETNINAT